MKRLLAVAAIAALTLALAGCSSSASSSNASSAASSGSASSAASASTTIANPWTDAATSEEAAKGAGITSFMVPEAIAIGDNVYKTPKFSSMDGIAQAQYEAGATAVIIRKSEKFSGIELTGDYNEYAAKWTQDLYGSQLICQGAQEGSISSVEWKANDANFSILYQGLGGEDVSMTSEEVATIIAGIV